MFPFAKLLAGWRRTDSLVTREAAGTLVRDRHALLVDRLQALHALRAVPLVANAVGATVAWAGLGGFGDPAKTLWLGAMLAAVAIDLATGPALLDSEPQPEAVLGDYRRAVAGSLAYGLVWGALASFFYGPADVAGRHLIVVVITAYVASSALMVAAVPAAAFAFAVPVVLQLALALIIDGAAGHVVLLALIAIYVTAFPLVLRRYWSRLDERTCALAEVDEQKHLFGVLLNDFETNSSDWLWQADADLRIRRISDGFIRQSGADPEWMNGVFIDDLIEASLTAEGVADHGAMRIRDRMHAREPFRDVPVRMVVGERERWWEVSGTPVWSRSGCFAGYRGIGRDVTEKRRAESELTYLAHHDTLTGGANRAAFNREIDRVGLAVAREGRRFALIQFDLDDFKAVNDTAGHATGDEVLAAAYRCIAGTLPPDAFMARIGGDEFAAIIEIGTAAAPAEVRQVVEAVVEAVSRPIEIAAGAFRVGVSAGVAVMPDNGSDARAVLQLADIALYNAKNDTRTKVHLASAEEGASYSYRKVLERDLRGAVEQRQFSLCYQPVVDAASGRVLVMEALLRWQHPQLGFVSPAEFVPIAEQTGAILQIGRWVLRKACRQAASWPDGVRVAVNISARQFDGEDLGAIVLDALRAAGLKPERLELEITESAFLGGVDRVRKTVARMQAYGVSVAMDDFGTGYSSLSSLQDVPFDKLKIDRSLVARDRHEKRAVSILKSIVAIGKALDLHVTAEGVETAEQAAFLKGLGCNSLQGYLFAKPMPAEALPAFFASETRRASGG